MPLWIALLNTLVAVAGAGFGVVALMAPGRVAPGRGAPGGAPGGAPAADPPQAVGMGVGPVVGAGVVPSVGVGVGAVPEVTVPAVRFYAAMYAARAIPFGLAVAVLVWVGPESPLALLVLGVAAIAQLGDAVIGVRHRLAGMVVGAVFATVCHGLAVLSVLLA